MRCWRTEHHLVVVDPTTSGTHFRHPCPSLLRTQATSFMTHLPADRTSLGLALARCGVVGMAASMPISRAVFNLSALALVVGWLLSGDLRGKWMLVRSSFGACAAIALFLVGALSLVWVTPLTADHWGQLSTYSRLLYIPMIVSLVTTAQWQRRAWTALLAGMLITWAAFVLDIWFEVPGTGTYGTHTAGQGVFHHHIAQSMVLSFLGACALTRALNNGATRSMRAAWLAVSLSTLAAIATVGQSRTGQLSVLLAYVLVILSHVPRRQRVWGIVLALAVSGTVVMGSSHMRERFDVALKETSSFEQNGEHTSVGARLKAWQFSAQLFEQSPWLGHGIGAYRPLAHQHFAPSPICQLGVCEQPHNQFILTAVESGMLGLLALAVFLAAPLFSRAERGSRAAQLTLPLLAIVVVTACFDSSLQIQAQLFFTVTALGLLLAMKTTEVSEERKPNGPSQAS